MGLRRGPLEYFFDMFKLAEYRKFDGLKMCELGNQRTKRSGREYLESNNIPPFETCKELFTHIGFQHTSIDVNGEDGALSIDLTKPIADDVLLSNFDVITNFGTTEHVSNQFECFKNMHNLCKENGLFINVVPSTFYRTVFFNTETSKTYITLHGLYNYDFRFFRNLSILCGYKILDERTIKNSVAFTMQKTTNKPFISKQRFDKIPIYIVKCEKRKREN